MRARYIWRTLGLLQRSGVRLYFFYRCDDICNVAFFSQEQVLRQPDRLFSADALGDRTVHPTVVRTTLVVGAIKRITGKARGKSRFAIERSIASAAGNPLSVKRLDKVIA